MENNNTANSTQKEFNVEEWAHQKRAERDSARKMIEDMTDAVRIDGSRFRECLDLISRFPRYSVGNILLIAAQKPEATKIGDFKYWKDAGAYIRKGEMGIIILEPGKEFQKKDGTTGVSYNAKRVFDISQTTSKVQEAAEVHRDGRLLLKALLNNAPCGIGIDDSMVAGGAPARYDASEKVIYVTRGVEPEKLFAPIAQEMAIAYMDNSGREFTEGENIAYCVAYILCKRNGLDTGGFSFETFPEDISSLDRKGTKTMLNSIRDVSGSISREMDHVLNRQKDTKSRDDAR